MKFRIKKKHFKTEKNFYGYTYHVEKKTLFGWKQLKEAGIEVSFYTMLSIRDYFRFHHPKVDVDSLPIINERVQLTPEGKRICIQWDEPNLNIVFSSDVDKDILIALEKQVREEENEGNRTNS